MRNCKPECACQCGQTTCGCHGKKRRDGWLVVAIVFAALALVCGAPPRADSAAPVVTRVSDDGCRGKMRLQGSSWRQTNRYGQPQAQPWAPEIGVRVRQNALAAYMFCPNGALPAKVKVKWLEHCWVAVDDRMSHYWFDGVRFNTFIYDTGGAEVNLPWHWVNDDGTRQNCESQDVPETQERWMGMPNNPRWNVWSYIVRNNLPDEGQLNWRTGTRTTKLIKPHRDIALGRWG
jgi:hypothetical protein